MCRPESSQSRETREHSRGFSKVCSKPLTYEQEISKFSCEYNILSHEQNVGLKQSKISNTLKIKGSSLQGKNQYAAHNG